MPRTIKFLNIFIASPGDVPAEYKAVHEICSKLNSSPMVKGLGFQLEPIGWEQAMPQAGNPQAIVNKIAAGCDLLICLFHRRLGPPAATQASGTLEEFLKAYDRWKEYRKPQIFLYFKEIKVLSINDLNIHQLRKVLEFKQRVQDDRLVLYKEFKDTDDFCSQLEDHIKQWLITLREKQQQLQQQQQQPRTVGENGTAISLEEKQESILILFLTANPTDTARLRLGEEKREVRTMLQAAAFRDRIRLEERTAVRTGDIMQALLDLKPRIVHFSGHGTKSGRLCIEDRHGNIHPVEAGALAELFKQFAGEINCVVLNACYSEIQARAIGKHIPYVVGMDKAIGDRAAIHFAAGFYQGIGAGATIRKAVALGCVKIRMENIPEYTTPVLLEHGLPVDWDSDTGGSERLVAAVPLPAQEVLDRYLKFAWNQHAHLPAQGFETSFRHPVLIERVYVKMRANPQTGACPETLEDREQHKQREDSGIVDIRGAFTALERHRIKDMVILGDPGSGKTTLCKYLVVMLADGKAEEQVGITGDLVPFYAPLRELRDPAGQDFEAFMAENCGFEDFGFSREAFRALLDSGRGLVLLDGLDEVADPGQRLQVIRWIDRARARYVDTRFVITSRFAGYSGEYQLSGNILPLSIQDFTLDEVRQFLYNWFTAVEECLFPGDESAGKRGREMAEKLTGQIGKSDRLKRFVTNPLILQITALVHRDRGRLPERRVELYQECTDILLGKWDMAKGMDVTIQAQDARMILQPLALWLHGVDQRRSAPLTEISKEIAGPLADLGKSSTDAEELLRNIRDRSGIFMGYNQEEYGFVHLSFQEYLAAEEIRNTRKVSLLVTNYSNRWWRETTLLALGLHNPSILKEFLEQIVLEPCFEEDVSVVEEAIGDSRLKPVDTLTAMLADKRVSRKAKFNILHLLRGIGNEQVAAVFRELAEGRNREIAEYVYEALKEMGQAGGIRINEIAKGRRKIIHEKDRSEMVLVPAGPFLFGSKEDDQDALQSEKPQLVVELPDYYIDKYPVTNRQFCRFLNKSKPGRNELEKWINLEGEYKKEKCRIRLEGNVYEIEQEFADYPVIYVTWYGADAYAQWAGKQLPTEQQWEKAARGTRGRKYPWGNEWKEGLCNSNESGIGMTTEVSKYPAGKSVYGCFDMAGNVWEWCQDWFDERYYEKCKRQGNVNNNKGPEKGSNRVLRGGSWYLNARYCRSAYRYCSGPGRRVYFIGFRLVFVPSP